VKTSNIGSSEQHSVFNKNKSGSANSNTDKSFDLFLEQTQKSNQNAERSRKTASDAATAESKPSTQNNLETYNSKKSNFMKAVEQALRDNMLGIDREKIKQLEKEMEVVKNNSTLSNDEKSKKLEDIQQQIDSIIKAAVERTKDKLSKESLNRVF